ncbi:unnamed protein product [Brugia timori]|uniref:Ovule protein n=1 Tax=Brugia timori TaxID=42155 RepID=A0A0R3Q3U2_9BILA|nr:unnamed protein product [Brugia timori]
MIYVGMLPHIISLFHVDKSLHFTSNSSNKTRELQRGLNGCLYGSLLIRFKFLRRATNLLALYSEQNIQSKCEYPKVHRTRMICLSSMNVV